MPRSAGTQAEPLDVVIVLVNDGHASTAVGPMEVFSSAGRLWDEISGVTPRSRFRVSTASVDGAPVESAFGLRVLPDQSLAEVAHADLVFVPSSGIMPDEVMQRHAVLLPWLVERHAQGALLAAVCSGAAFFAEAGLLNGRRATTHWGVANAFGQRYPQVNWCPDLLITEDERIFCGGGVNAATDLSLFLVERLCGRDTAIGCAKALILDMPRTHQSGYAILPIARPHADARVREFEEYLNASFHKKLSIDSMAQRFGMSRRNLIRRFKSATGHLPSAYLQMIRVAAARRLLEEGADSLDQVAMEVGYSDVAHFRTLFKRHTGETPSAYRERFRSKHGAVA
ncbi:MAG: helix-turn-helix domain-containing protein [Wenzhouxiangella sp.]|nr:helix-turn-helix domain-containing protein [Wenzhouxiangella sp.]